MLFWDPLLIPETSPNEWEEGLGDCCARGADLFESLSAEIIAAMILAGSLTRGCKYVSCNGSLWIISCLKQVSSGIQIGKS